MKNKLLICIAILLSLSSCQTLYSYRFLSESEQKSFPADSLRWGYTGMTITSIPVVDGEGNMFRLAITPKTKIEVKTVYGEVYKFYIQSIKITGNDGFLGGDQMWSGYDLINHVQKVVIVKEIVTMTILSDEKALLPLRGQ